MNNFKQNRKRAYKYFNFEWDSLPNKKKGKIKLYTNILRIYTEFILVPQSICQDQHSE